jgi:50S ribosomal protein L16 3-hydroxylase
VDSNRFQTHEYPIHRAHPGDKIPDVNNRILGGLSASAFLHRHWQKQPLLVRGAIPGFAGLLDFGAMIELAAPRRLRIASGRAPKGPVGGRTRALRAQTVFGVAGEQLDAAVARGVDKVMPAARRLLSQFDFIPYSRFDDLMVSYAPAGGGVGPHFDSYDVFLLQGPGQRRWQVGRQRNLALLEDAPLKILKRFIPDGQCLLSAGDPALSAASRRPRRRRGRPAATPIRSDFARRPTAN